MASMAIIVFFAFIINSVNSEMGFAEFLITNICKALPMQLLPLLIFLIMSFATFATAGYWLMQVIALPIFLPMAAIAGLSPAIALACVMSGVTLVRCNIYDSGRERYIECESRQNDYALCRSRGSNYRSRISCSWMSLICFGI